MNPIDYRCSHWFTDHVCPAGPGDPCESMPVGQYHSERMDDAASMNREGNVDPVKVEAAIKRIVDSRF